MNNNQKSNTFFFRGKHFCKNDIFAQSVPKSLTVKMSMSNVKVFKIILYDLINIIILYDKLIDQKITHNGC